MKDVLSQFVSSHFNYDDIRDSQTIHTFSTEIAILI